jgi:hypothetical protein
VSVWSWLKLAAGLWLIRKAVKGAGWLLLAAVLVAAWPLTVIVAAGYVASWWRGYPPAWLLRTAAWSLIGPAAWLAAAALRAGRLRAEALAAVRSWAHWWPPPTGLQVARTFALLAPATLLAGLALAAGVWAWRNYAITTGLGGFTASAPVTFDRRQWKRQVRSAKGLTEAPGAVPLLARGGKIPVGGTIRAIGHRWHPVFTLPAQALARHMVIVGGDRQREDEPDDPAVGGLVHRHPGRLLRRDGEPAAADRAGLQGRPRRPQESRPHPPAALRGGSPPGRGLAR